MKRVFTCLFLFCLLVGKVFGQDSPEIEELVAQIEISVLMGQIDGTTQLPQGIVRSSPDTYLGKGSGEGFERILVYTTNNFLGVVAIAITDTGYKSEDQFRKYRRAVTNSKYWQLENPITNTNNIRGTLKDLRNGHKYGFSLEYIPQNQQLVMTVIRQ